MANSPHLLPALEIDDAILALSGKLASLGVPTLIDSEADLAKLGKALDETLTSLNLYEFYAIDVPTHVQELKAALGALGSKGLPAWKGTSDLSSKSTAQLAELLKTEDGAIEGLGKFAKRKGVKVNLEVALSFVGAAFADGGAVDAERLSQAWAEVLDVINVDLYKEFNADGAAMRENVVSRVKYERLEAGGLRMGEISAK